MKAPGYSWISLSLFLLPLLPLLPPGTAPLRAAAPSGRGPAAPPVLLRLPGPGDPLVFKPGCETGKSWVESETRWMEKNLLPVITKGWDGQPWRDQGLAFLRERLPRMQYQSPWGQKAEDLKVSGASLLAAGCRNPWVRLWEAWDRQRGKEGFDAERDLPVMTAALKEIRGAVTDPALLRIAALPLIQDADNYPQSGPWPDEKAEISEAFMKWTEQLGKSPSYGPKDGGQLFRHICHIPTRRKGNPDAIDRLQKAGTLPPWMMDTMLGGRELDLAWKSRGTGWASSVTEEGWEGFRKHLALARRHLTAAWKAQPDQPYAAASMIKVVMGEGAEKGESDRLWFNRATAACFDYFHAYANYVQCLLPRWGGSQEALLEFGFACMDAGRMETEVPLMLPRTLTTIGWDLGAYDKVYTLPGVPERLKKLNAALLKAEGGKQEMMDRRSHIMLDSWFLRDWGTGLQAARGNNSEFTASVDSRMSRMALTRVKIATDLAVLGAPERESARQAEERERAGEMAQAVDLWKKTLSEFQGPDWVKEAVRARLRAAELGRDYQAGKTVRLPVDHSLDWDQLQGDWEVVKGQGLTVPEDSGTGVQLASYPLPLGESFELKAKIRMTGPLESGLHPPCLMLSAGFNPFSYFCAWTVVAELSSDGVRGSLGRDCFEFPKSPRVNVSAKPSEALEMRLVRKDGSLTFTIDGDTVFENADEGPGSPDWERGIVSVGGCLLPEGGRVIVESVEARKLP